MRILSRSFLFLFIFMMPLFLITGCTPAATTAAEKTADAPQEDVDETVEAKEEIINTGAASAEAVVINGEIGNGEYMASLQDNNTGIQLFWSNDSQDLYIGIITDSGGWVAVGFDPQSAMKGANIIFMALDGGTVLLRDDFGTSSFSHDSDEKLGGSNDISESAGKKDGDKAVYEFIIPLDSSDEFDKVLSPGNSYKVILSLNSSNTDFDRKHSARSSNQITLK